MPHSRPHRPPRARPAFEAFLRSSSLTDVVPPELLPSVPETYRALIASRVAAGDLLEMRVNRVTRGLEAVPANASRAAVFYPVLQARCSRCCPRWMKKRDEED